MGFYNGRAWKLLLSCHPDNKWF